MRKTSSAKSNQRSENAVLDQAVQQLLKATKKEAAKRRKPLDGEKLRNEGYSERFIIRTFRITALCLFSTLCAALADDALPKTLMTTRGKLLASENFDKPLPPFTGTPVGFASGFFGWRYNAQPTGGKSGRWEVINGTFKGIESPGANHPATASFGMQYQDAIIQCDVRLDDAPAEGRLYRSLFVKATDAKDYVCALGVGPGGLYALAYDDSRSDPKSKQREKFPPVRVTAPVKLDEWHTTVLEIKGNELVATLDGTSVTIRCPLTGAAKQSVMLGASTVASFRNFRMWEALPNPDWMKNKEALPATSKQDTSTLPPAAPPASK